MEAKKITIIGLGLIGGSLARVLRYRMNFLDITAINRSSDPLSQAINDGVISRGFNELNEYVYNSDIIFICTPVKRTMEYLDLLVGKVRPDCIITDVGSTKEEIIEYADTLPADICFVGGHPMAGTEKTGYSSSFEHLFENAFYILSSCKNTSKAAMDTMVELVSGIGGIPVLLDAHEHDKITATISHVPHIIASTLVNMVRQSSNSDNTVQMLAAGGFKDITRIASSSPEIWENIVLSNRQQITGIISDFIKILVEFQKHIEANDSLRILSFLQSAKVYRDSFSSVKTGIKPFTGLINPIFEIIVDVIDKPGIIGEIASLLGANSINIKNINVSNNREYEQGCLTITLPDSESTNFAFELLTSKGYIVYNNRL